MDVDFYKPEHKRFMDDLLVRRYGTADREVLRLLHGADPVGDTLFKAISEAFMSNGSRPFSGSGNGLMQISPEMVQYLACTAEDRAGMQYAQPKILGWFMVTIREAIKAHRDIEFRDRKILYGCFDVPRWYFERCAEWGRLEDEHRKELRKEWGPGYHLCLVRSADDEE